MTNFWQLLFKETAGTWLDNRKSIFITGNSNLVIGPYVYLTTYATNLWHDHTAQKVLREKQVKLGLRATDVIVDTTHLSDKEIDAIRQSTKQGFRKETGYAVTSDDQLKILKESFEHLRKDSNNTFNERITDVYQAAQNYFASITLESHHIVEKSMLKQIGKNVKDFDDDIAPCVLLKGELHRRLLTPEGSAFRKGQ